MRCSSAQRRASRKYYSLHKEECRARNREYCKCPKRKEYSKKYNRDHYLLVNGKIVRVSKRPFPRRCELCNREKKRFAWHHWDDRHPEFGLWLCNRCHLAAEAEEENLIDKYRELKRWSEENAL